LDIGRIINILGASYDGNSITGGDGRRDLGLQFHNANGLRATNTSFYESRSWEAKDRIYSVTRWLSRKIPAANTTIYLTSPR